MKHEVLEAVEVVPPVIVNEVVFTPAPKLAEAIEAERRYQEGLVQRQRDEAMRRERQEAMYQAIQCDCTASRSRMMTHPGFNHDTSLIERARRLLAR